MTAKVTVNYNKYVSGNIIPSTDFENQVLADIIEWSYGHIQNVEEIDICSLIEIYWGWHLGTIDFIEIPKESQQDAEIIPMSEKTEN